MKRKILTILMAAFMCTGLWAMPQMAAESHAAAKPVTVYMNDSQVNFDVQPCIVNGRTMVPLRSVFEKFGMKVEWDNSIKSIYAYNDDNYVYMEIGEKDFAANGKAYEMDVPAMILSSRTLVPLRAISEALNAEVSWDNKERRVDIKIEYFNPKQPAEDGYMNPGILYLLLNDFRTTEGVWQWNEDNKTKTYKNTKEAGFLKELTVDKSLEETAKLRAKEIATKFDHQRPNGQDCFTAYPGGLTAMGENIAKASYNNPATAQFLWEEEDDNYEGQGHRRNMLEDMFTKVGIAVYKSGNMLYYVQCFGR